MKKKIMLLAGLFIVVSVAGYRLHAGRGGNAFGGAFAGSMFGSVVGNAMTAPRGGGGDSGSSNSGALNAVWDAFPTAVSIVGQFLLGRKYIENWAVWLAVNVVSVGLFAWKGLWLTTLLYGLFTALSAVGWRAWQRKL